MSGVFGTYFYHRIIRKLVVAIGSMFNDIQIVRYNKAGTVELERMLVPILYGQKEKYLYRIIQDPTLNRSIQIQLPRMSFELVSMNYDSSRKQNSLTTDYRLAGPGQAFRQYTGIPYDFVFNLSIYVRNFEDGAQVVEQILPIFKPDYTMTLDLVETMGVKRDVAVVLNNVNYNIQYEGDGDEMRIIIWDITFTVKAWLFNPVANTAIILNSQTRFLNFPSQTNQITVLNVYTGGNGTFQQGETVYQGPNYNEAKVQGTVVEWDSLNKKLYLNNVTTYNGQTGLFSANVNISGVNTGATWEVYNTYTTNPALAIVTVTPNPPTANTPNASNGFITTITEFPNTL